MIQGVQNMIPELQVADIYGAQVRGQKDALAVLELQDQYRKRQLEIQLQQGKNPAEIYEARNKAIASAPVYDFNSIQAALMGSPGMQTLNGSAAGQGLNLGIRQPTEMEAAAARIAELKLATQGTQKDGFVTGPGFNQMRSDINSGVLPQGGGAAPSAGVRAVRDANGNLTLEAVPVTPAAPAAPVAGQAPAQVVAGQAQVQQPIQQEQTAIVTPDLAVARRNQPIDMLNDATFHQIMQQQYARGIQPDSIQKAGNNIIEANIVASKMNAQMNNQRTIEQARIEANLAESASKQLVELERIAATMADSEAKRQLQAEIAKLNGVVSMYRVDNAPRGRTGSGKAPATDATDKQMMTDFYNKYGTSKMEQILSVNSMDPSGSLAKLQKLPTMDAIRSEAQNTLDAIVNPQFKQQFRAKYPQLLGNPGASGSFAAPKGGGSGGGSAGKKHNGKDVLKFQYKGDKTRITYKDGTSEVVNGIIK